MFEVHAHSEAGGHTENEDAYLCQAHPADAGCLLCVVADGQGGRHGGGPAARLACQTVMEWACWTPAGMLASAKGWGYLLPEADRAVAADPEAGFTTLVGFCVRRNRVVGASCGDSAVLLVSRAGAAVLTDGQPKNPPVGSGSAAFAEFTAEPGDDWRVLAMSDGVWKYAGWDRVRDAVRSLDGAAALARMRADAALPATGGLQDDFTAVLVTPAETSVGPAPARRVG